MAERSPSLAERVRPAQTALVVIDMQNDFFHPEGANGAWIRARWEADEAPLDARVNPMEPIVDRLIGLIEAARAAGVPVVWCKVVNTPETDARYWRSERWTFCQEGTWGAEWYGGLAPKPGELEVVKRRHSAFFCTDLDLILRRQRIEAVVLAGTATHGCVEGTARDAMAHDYWTVVAGDCCGQLDMVAHEQALQRIDRLFGMAATADTIARVWAASSARR